MAEVIEFGCPDCQAEPGKRCVYIAPVPARTGYSVNAEQAARAGKPTKRFHNGRYRALYLWELQAERLAMLEYLRWWLSEFGDIFKEHNAHNDQAG